MVKYGQLHKHVAKKIIEPKLLEDLTKKNTPFQELTFYWTLVIKKG